MTQAEMLQDKVMFESFTNFLPHRLMNHLVFPQIKHAVIVNKIQISLALNTF